MDGNFKLSALGTKADKINILDDVIVNIRPAELNQEKHKTVTLEQGGLLRQSISDEEARNLTSLTAHTISAYLFHNCTNLKELILPDQTIEIQPRAFANCKSLQQMRIPSQTKTLYPNAWSGCFSMRAVSVCSTNSEYMDKEGIVYSKDTTMMVYYPSNKTDSVYSMPQSVSGLHSYAFSESFFLRSIQLSESLKRIPRYAFYNCPQIRSVRLPESIEEIAPKAFVSCKSLTTVHFNSKLQNAGSDVLFRCGKE